MIIFIINYSVFKLFKLIIKYKDINIYIYLTYKDYFYYYNKKF